IHELEADGLLAAINEDPIPEEGNCVLTGAVRASSHGALGPPLRRVGHEELIQRQHVLVLPERIHEQRRSRSCLAGDDELANRISVLPRYRFPSSSNGPPLRCAREHLSTDST